MRRNALIGLALWTLLACEDSPSSQPDNSLDGNGDQPIGDGDSAGDGETVLGDGDVASMGDGDVAGDGDSAGDGETMPGDGDGAMGDGDGSMMGQDAGMQAAPQTTYERIAGGTFGPLAGYESHAAQGAALLAVHADGTEVSLQISGLDPDTTYPTHVHGLPCALAGGGHYKLDPTVTDAVESNELWPGVTTDADGAALALLRSDHVARADAMAIVIHDPGAMNAKMLCADLMTGDAELASLEGTFAAFADAEAGDMGIVGTAKLTRSATGTTVTLHVEGLSEGTVYPTHVHALPCDVDNAGGHYKRDPSVMDTTADNELWPTITVTGDGTGQTTLTDTHVARPDAQSVVIHRETGSGAPKVACADLVDAPRTLVYSGDPVTLQAASDRGLTNLSGDADLKRNPDGTASVQVELGGLAPGTEYPTHLHDRPCGVSDGGGHYKHDTGESETIEANEVWLTFMTDATGAGEREVDLTSLPRADAQSIVVHDPSDGARLACLPLR